MQTSSSSPIIIGSRGSKLALWQAHYTRRQLEAAGFAVTIKVIQTKGDRIQHLSFDKIEGKGFFTKEIEDALLQHEIDLAVHSYKDLPTENPPGLVIGASSYRANPYDCLVIRKKVYAPLLPLGLPPHAIVGTSSARRKAQLLAHRDDLLIKDIRGNVPTRIRKLEEGQFDAIMLAKAGLDRLELELEQCEVIELGVPEMVPAASQGVLAFQIREHDERMQEVVQVLHDTAVAESVQIERRILQQTGGGCQQPLGIHCLQKAGVFHLWVSQAKDARAFPYRFYLSGTNADTLVQEAMAQLAQGPQAKRVFISRELQDDAYLAKAAKAWGLQLHAEALQDYTPLRFTDLPAYDWVFFSSKNGVKHFIEQLPSRMASKIAVMGKGTLQALHRYGYQADFVGAGGDVQQTARDFLVQAKGQRVLFPMAQNSVQSIQKLLADELEVLNLAVYRNELRTDFEIPTCEVLVFTSPRNARAYFEKYQWQEGQRVVAIGKTTGKYLQELGVAFVLPYASDMWSLGDVV